MRRFGGVACVFVHAPFVFGGFGCVEEGKAERCDRSFETKGLCASVDDCPSWQTLEAGLARAVELLPEEPLLSLHYEECENGLQIDFGLSPHSFDYYQYDLATKELVGVGSFGDGVTAEDKCNKLPFVDCNNRCSFVETSVDTSWLYGGTACSGPLAEPFIADCNEAMASLSEECRSCACEACYPVLPRGSDDAFRESLEEMFVFCATSKCDDCGVTEDFELCTVDDAGCDVSEE